MKGNPVNRKERIGIIGTMSVCKDNSWSTESGSDGVMELLCRYYVCRYGALEDNAERRTQNAGLLGITRIPSTQLGRGANKERHRCGFT